jgi:alpha-galactosidase
MKYLVDYVHSKGLNSEFIPVRGQRPVRKDPVAEDTNFRMPNLCRVEEVDYLKYDWCNHSTQNAQASYSLMRDALYKAGDPWYSVYANGGLTSHGNGQKMSVTCGVQRVT